MQAFPKLKNDQIALLRAERTTGHVVDINLSLVISEQQEVYSIFENVDLARSYITSFLKTDDRFEYVLYNKDKVVVSFTSVGQTEL